MSDPADDLRSQFRAAMRRHPAAVTIVTAADDRRHHGMTATAVTSLSLEPPSLLVCVNQTTLLHDILLAARRFCVNLLGSGQADVSGAFSGALPPGKRFDLGAWQRTAEGIDLVRFRERYGIDLREQNSRLMEKLGVADLTGLIHFAVEHAMTPS